LGDAKRDVISRIRFILRTTMTARTNSDDYNN